MPLRLFLALALVAPTSALAAVDAFLYIPQPDLYGSSPDPVYADWHRLNSWAFDGFRLAEHDQAGNVVASPAFPSEVVVTRYADVVSGGLQAAVLDGRALGDVEIAVRRTGGRPDRYIEVVLTDAVLTSYTVSTDVDGSIETLGLHYGLLTLRTWNQGPDGGVEGPPIETCFDPAPTGGPSCP